MGDDIPDYHVMKLVGASHMSHRTQALRVKLFPPTLPIAEKVLLVMS
jgi:hypothetical protein